MGIVYKADVFCDGCGNWIDGGETQRDGIAGMSKMARRMARTAGWQGRKRSGRFEDICPSCQQRELQDLTFDATGVR